MDGGKGGGERRVVLIAKRGRFLVGEPLFERGERLALSGGPRVGAGRMALVERGGRGARVVRELGTPTAARDVLEALLADRGLRRGFSGALEAEAGEAASRAGADSEPRRDLTGLPTFTVDPATARDFDDAVSAEALSSGGGTRIWVHIADVAAHVRPGSALESEAHERANSVYVPGSVEPMLPHALSSDACSLTPGRPRLAVTAELELGAGGEARSARFYRSLIRSDARLDYDQLDRVFAGSERPAEVVAEPLALARRAASALAGRAHPGLEIESTEPEFEFDGGDVVAARAVPQTEAHRLIERLMVHTNERVAELLERKRMPTLYRVHEQPDTEAIEWLVKQLAALDVPTPPLPKHLSPGQAGEIAIEASRLAGHEAARRGHGREAYTSLVLRSLKQAHYSDRNLGHAGLGSPAYAHFTSPIRRYPDLIAHRALLSAIGAGEKAPSADLVAEAGPHASERERDASRLERDADSVCAAFLLQRELFEAGPGATFEGEVSGVIGAGAFVRFRGALADVYEGFLPARRIGGRERYELDRTETMLLGARGGAAVRLGDPVSVSVDRVDAPRGRVDLLPAGDGSR
jgi:ribonuclease R